MRSDDSTEMRTTDDDCPACGATRLRAWGELSEEEREVARRLPAPAGREARRRFCVRCWHEEDEDRARTV
ncbi:MAG: hypothetical protein LC800_05210 [Acidobacteria bacterium]|nr:hypothetical protein [Acidobacteriota bacterium]